MSTEPLHANRDRAESFGSVADDYDRFRPSHAPELIAELAAADPQTALDIACGTGKVAAALRDAGVDVLGVEIDPRMAEVARAHGLIVDVAPFEDWESAGRTFGLITCGSAWHWLDPELATTKVAAILQKSGTFARMWSFHHVDPEYIPVLQAVYDRVGGGAHVHGAPPAEDRQAEDTVAISRAFSDVESRDFHRTHTLSVEAWVGLIATFSDHQLLGADRLSTLQAAVRDALAPFGEVRTTEWTHARLARRL